jgi:hypothetical protein
MEKTIRVMSLEVIIMSFSIKAPRTNLIRSYNFIARSLNEKHPNLLKETRRKYVSATMCPPCGKLTLHEFPQPGTPSLKPR